MAWVKPKSEEAILNYQIRQLAMQERDKAMTRIAKVGEQTILEKGKNIIRKWFSDDGVDMSHYFKCLVKKETNTTFTGTVEFEMFLETSDYDRSGRLFAWRQRRGLKKEWKDGLVNKELVSDEWNGGYRGAGDFTLNLPWEKGIIGLPHHGVRKIPPGTKITYGHVNENGVWENDDFKQQKPLKLIIKQELTSDEFKRNIIRKAGYGVK